MSRAGKTFNNLIIALTAYDYLEALEENRKMFLTHAGTSSNALINQLSFRHPTRVYRTQTIL